MLKHLSSVDLALASELLNEGKLVAFKTETVYGLGADVRNSNAIRNIYSAKKREPRNPLIVHVNSIEMASRYCKQIDNISLKLMKIYWPGPLTFILPKINNESVLCNLVTADTSYVGLRCPSNEDALRLITRFGNGIAAPSANISGHVSSTRTEHIKSDFNYTAEDMPEIYIYQTLNNYNNDKNYYCNGIESTIIKCNSDNIEVLREGSISLDHLKNTLAINSIMVDVFVNERNITNSSFCRYTFDIYIKF